MPLATLISEVMNLFSPFITFPSCNSILSFLASLFAGSQRIRTLPSITAAFFLQWQGPHGPCSFGIGAGDRPHHLHAKFSRDDESSVTWVGAAIYDALYGVLADIHLPLDLDIAMHWVVSRWHRRCRRRGHLGQHLISCSTYRVLPLRAVSCCKT
jgi:hypothetical protein